MGYGIGIIGYGFMGQIHHKNIDRCEQAKVVAVCDINPSQLELAKDTGVKTFINADDLLALDEVEVVIISVNNHIHKEMVFKSAKAKKHIICEKPCAMSVAEFDEMVNVAEENGTTFTVHHQRRWDRDFCIAKEVYSKNMVGQVYTIKSSLYGVNGNMHDWHVYKKFGGGMLTDWGVHLLDQMLNMVDSPVVSVYADIRNVINFEVDDYFKIIMNFANGVVGEVELGTYYLRPSRNWVICGDKGSMFIDGFESKGAIVRTRKLLKNVPGQITMTAAGPTRSFGPPEPGLLYEEPLPNVEVDHMMFFDNYFKTLENESEFCIQLPQVRRVLALIEAAWHSAETKKSVVFEA